MTGTPPPFNPPSTARETELLLKGMADQVKNLVVFENARFAEQMGVAGELGEQHAAMQEQARQEQGQLALQQTMGSLLNADFRDMGMRDQLQEQIASLAHAGLGAEQIQPLQDFHHDAGMLTDYLTEDAGRIDQYLGQAAESGLLPRLLAAFGRGGKQGLMMADRSTREEVIDDALTKIIESRLGARFPGTHGLAQQDTPHPYQPAPSHPFAELAQGMQPRAETLEGVIDPEQYRGLLGKQVEQSIRRHGEGMEEGFLEKIVGGGGHMLGMLAPLGAVMKGGQQAAQGATGAVRFLGGLARGGVETSKVAGIGATIMELGVANTRLGAALQRWGGGMGALFGVGAGKPLSEREEARIAALPEERQDAAHKAARIMAGIDLAMTGPMMMLGIKGAHAPGLVSRIGAPAAGAVSFGVAGEVTGAAQMGMSEIAKELSPEYARQLQLQIIADPDLRGPLTQMGQALAANDYRAAVEAGERLAEEWGAGFVGFGLINVLTAAKRSGQRDGMEDVIARVRFRALKEAEELSAEAEVVQEIKAAVNAKFDQLRPSAAERDARKTMEELGERTGGKAREAIEERLAVERLDVGEAADLAGRRGEIQGQLGEMARTALEGGKRRDVAEWERLEAADEYLRAVEVAGRTEGPGRSDAMLQAEAWLEHFGRLSRGEMSEMPSAATYEAMRERAPAIEAARELRFEERGLAAARGMLAEPQASTTPAEISRSLPDAPEVARPQPGVLEVPAHQAAKRGPAPDYGAWGIPESPEAVGSQVAARVRLSERAKSLRSAISSVEQAPRGSGGRSEVLAGLHRGDAFSRDYAQDVAEAMRRVPNAGSHRLAAEALYLNLRRAAGEPPPKETLGREVERLGEEFRVVEAMATENPALFLSWARQSHPELQGSLGEAMAHYKPGVELTQKMEAFQQEHVFRPANLEHGPYAMGILPFAKEIQALRDVALFGDGGVVRSLDKWTKQANSELLDPKHLKRWGDIPIGPIRTPTHLLARLTRIFEHPISEFGNFAVEAGRMTAMNQLTVKDLRGWFASVAKKHGIEEWTGFKKPKDLETPDAKHGSHLAQMLLAEPDQNAAIWKTAPKHVVEFAREVQPMLETLRQAAAESTPWWRRREDMLRASERIEGRAAEDLAGTEAERQLRLDAGMAQPDIAQTTKGVEDMRQQLKKARGRRSTTKGQLTRAQKAGKPTDVLEGKLAEREAKVAELEAELKTWGDALARSYETYGLDSPYRLDSAITALKREVSKQQSFRDRVTAEMDAYRDSWGIDGYAPQIATVLVDRDNRALGLSGVKAELRDQPSYGIEMVMTGAARRRTGRLEAKGNVDPDIMRSMNAYIGRIVPFIETQRFLNQYGERIYGKWDELPERWRFDGVDPKRKGTDEWNVDIRVDPLAEIEGVSSPAPFHQILGTFHSVKAKDGRTFRHVREASEAIQDVEQQRREQRERRAITGMKGRKVELEGAELDKVVLAWRGDGKLHRDMLQDPAAVDTMLKSGNLVAVPERIATDAIRVRHGGFKQLAHPKRYESLQEYIEVLTRPRTEALGIPTYGPILESVDKFSRTAAYMMSTNTLGWLNYGSAMNAGTGALFINTMILGPRRAATSLGYWWDFLARVKKAKLNGDPLEDLALTRQEGRVTPDAPLHALRMEKYKRVRDGRDEILDDAYEWVLRSSLLSNTRGISWFDRTKPFKSALEPAAWDRKTGEVTKWKRNFATKPGSVAEAVKDKGGQFVEAGWAFFGSDPSAPFAGVGFEGAVRVSLAVDAYVSARRKGRTPKEAENLASQAVILAHGMFNPALRSRFFRAGPGQMIGTVNAWATQWIGVMNRLPAAQRTKVLAGVLTAAYVGAQWGLDPLEYLGIPVDEDTDNLFGKGAASDLSGVVGMNLKDVPGVGPYLNEVLQESSAMQWLNQLNGGEVFPAGVPLPLMITAADSPFLDVVESVIQGVEAGSQGRADRMSQVFGRALNKAMIPRTAELIHKAFGTEPNPEGGYDYTPWLTSGYSTRLWDRGLAQVWKDFLPGQVMSSAVQHEAISRARVAAERDRATSKDLGEELVRTTSRMIRLDEQRSSILRERGLSDAYYDAVQQDRTDEFLQQHGEALGSIPAEREQVMDEMTELRRRASAAGKPIDASKMTEARKRAKLRMMGLRQLELAIYRAPSKAQKVEQLVKWMENPHSRINEATVRNVERILGGDGPPQNGVPRFDYWLHDMAARGPGKEPTVPPALAQRYWAAREKRLTPQ